MTRPRFDSVTSLIMLICCGGFTLDGSADTSGGLGEFNTTNVKNMHLHRDSNPGPWNTVPML